MIRACMSRLGRGGRITAALIVVGVLAACTPLAPVTYQGFTYSTGITTSPTADKPQSKIWYNDGAWWGLLLAPNGKVQIFELLANHTWRDTGTVVDDRATSTGDALWDGATGKLYVGSRVDGGGEATLARLSYNSGTRSYTMDSGFPDQIAAKSTESLTIAKDSTGLVWATQVRNGKVYVAHTTAGSDDKTWTALFQPAGGTPAALRVTSRASPPTTSRRSSPSAARSVSSGRTSWTAPSVSRCTSTAAADSVWTTEVAFSGPLMCGRPHEHQERHVRGRRAPVRRGEDQQARSRASRCWCCSPGPRPAYGRTTPTAREPKSDPSDRGARRATR